MTHKQLIAILAVLAVVVIFCLADWSSFAATMVIIEVALDECLALVLHRS